MKNGVKRYFLTTAIIFVCSFAVNAQQKPSDKSLAEEMKIINAKKAARNAFIRKMQQSTPADDSQVTIDANQRINADTKKTGNNKPSTTNNQPERTNPSQQPIRIPKKPVLVRQYQEQKKQS